MSPAIPASRLTRLFVLGILLLVGSNALADPAYRYESSDGQLIFQPTEEFQRTVNPHAILSLQSPQEAVVLVTSEEEKFTTQQLFDGLPSTFDEGAVCVGRVLLSVDSEDAPTFLIEGMFPPEGPSSHHTLYAVANHEKVQYTFMIHYPKELGDQGFEWAAELLQRFTWGKAKNMQS